MRSGKPPRRGKGKPGASARGGRVRPSSAPWEITTHSCDETRPFWARLIIAGCWDGEASSAARLLQQLCGEWPQGVRSRILVACGGFIEFPWPPAATPKAIGKPSDPAQGALDLLGNAADRALAAVLTPDVRERLARHTDAVALGVDSHSSNSLSKPHVEFSYLVNLPDGPTRRVAKSYPAGCQEWGLVRNPDVADHFVTFDGQPTLLLQCHDLTAFNPRGNATAKGWRAAMIQRFHDKARCRQPQVVIHYPHTAETPRTWSASWNRLCRIAGSAEHYAAAGRFSYNGGCPRGKLEAVRAATVRGASIDFVARVNGRA